MTISDRIFEKLKERNMSQRVFAESTGITQSAISEWKIRRTNPTSEKIMIICKVLEVSPEWLLSGSGDAGERRNDIPWYVVDRDTEMGELLTAFHKMTPQQRERLRGYVEALMES